MATELRVSRSELGRVAAASSLDVQVQRIYRSLLLFWGANRGEAYPPSIPGSEADTSLKRVQAKGPQSP